MSSPAALVAREEEAIASVVWRYVDGGVSGRGDDMRPAFHREATIFGNLGGDLLAGSVEKLFAWTDGIGPAGGLQARIAGIDLAETVATVRLELDDWTGHRFTDLLTLLKVDGAWTIVNKVFHLHT